MGVQSKNSEKWEKISIMENNTQMRFITYLDRNHTHVTCIPFCAVIFSTKNSKLRIFPNSEKSWLRNVALPHSIPNEIVIINKQKSDFPSTVIVVIATIWFPGLNKEKQKKVVYDSVTQVPFHCSNFKLNRGSPMIWMQCDRNTKKLFSFENSDNSSIVDMA